MDKNKVSLLEKILTFICFVCACIVCIDVIFLLLFFETGIPQLILLIIIPLALFSALGLLGIDFFGKE